MEIVWRWMSWWMRPLEMGLPYSGRPWHDWRWKFSLAFRNETQEPLSLSALNGNICSYVPSSSD